MKRFLVTIQSSLCLVIIFWAFSNIQAQDVAQSPALVSNKLVFLKFSSPDGNWMRPTVPQGGALVVDNHPSRFEFTVTIKDEHTISVQILKLISGTMADRRAIEISVGALPIAVPSLPFLIEVERISDKDDVIRKNVSPACRNIFTSVSSTLPRSNIPTASGLFQDEGLCCVICSGVRTCACYVQASCGSCCAAGCC